MFKTRKFNKVYISTKTSAMLCSLVNYYFKNYSLENSDMTSDELVNDKYNEFSGTISWRIINKNTVFWFIYKQEEKNETFEFCYDFANEEFYDEKKMLKIKDVIDSHNNNPSDATTIIMNTNSVIAWDNEKLKWKSLGTYEVINEFTFELFFFELTKDLIKFSAYYVDLWSDEEDE